MSPLPRVDILGVRISAINPEQTVAEIEGWIGRRERHYVNVCNVHTIMECQQDPRLTRVVNNSGLSTPDGMPLVWLSRLHGFRNAARVYGPDLMLALCERSETNGHRHFFYGGAPGIAERLADQLQRRFPRLQIAGIHAPPFRKVGAIEERPVLDTIDAASPDVVWVGLGTPKQDHWVADHRPLLDAPVIIAIGAAFDFHAGVLRQAPRWMQRSGLEWSFRLAQEPRRLAYRYLVLNPLFVLNAFLQATKLRRFESDTTR